MGVLEALYLANCGISMAAYLPQIVKLLKDKSDSSSVSISSWLLWVYTSFIGMAYAMFVNGDVLFMLSGGLAVLFCSIVVGLLCFNRYAKFRIAGRANVSILELIKRKPAHNDAHYGLHLKPAYARVKRRR